MYFPYVFRSIPLETLVEIGSDYHTIIRGYSEEGDKTHPDCHTQVIGVHLEQVPHIGPENGEIHKPSLSIQPEHQKTSRKSQCNSGKDKERGRYGTELEVQDKKNGDQG